MTGGDLVKWGIIGLAGWWVYETFFATPAAATSTAAPAATTTATPAATTTAAPAATTPAAPVTSASQPFSTLDAIYNAMLAAAQAGQTAGDTAVTGSGSTLSATGNVWNYYLSQVDANAGATAGTIINSQTAGATNSAVATYTGAAYWAIVGPAIGSAYGLSGVRMGLAGLGAVLRHSRRRHF